MSNIRAVENGQSKDMTECKRRMLPVLDALAVLSGKWKFPIIIALSHNNNRFKEIVRAVPGLTDKTLSKELKEMAEDQLIERIVYETFPPKVEYYLTDHAKSLTSIIEMLREWGLQHRKKILG
ncbi:winged helix-turn-helix transcriptional regulator [Tannerella forsythia]|uniref:Transcriptional regulator n=1 Tax=Tannerella forsythia TaxID=28112 RepID=A0A3P1XFH6_TANFO|nr:helix-turn-helix domain-containing protein [Tannerella forsythia]RRD57564.1 transcriptional regulator [Tannerella forsythia]